MNTKLSPSEQLLFNLIPKGNFNAIRDLIQSGVNINAICDGGVTLLMWCIHNHRYNIVPILINAGANVNAATINGITALMITASHKKLRIANMLIQAKAHINATDIWGNTPIFYATNFIATAILIEAGADVNVSNKKGLTPLLLALKRKKIKTFKLLLDKGAHPLVLDNNKHNAFYYIHTYLSGRTTNTAEKILTNAVIHYQPAHVSTQSILPQYSSIIEQGREKTNTSIG